MLPKGNSQPLKVLKQKGTREMLRFALRVHTGSEAEAATEKKLKSFQAGDLNIRLESCLHPLPT